MTLVMIAICNCNALSAQETIRKVDNKTFLVKKGSVRNLNKPAPKVYKTLGHDYEVINNSIVPDTFKKVLSKERIKELKDKRINILFYCLPSGKVESVTFVSGFEICLTLEEISKLEDAFLAQTFPIKASKGFNSKIGFAYGFQFRNLQ